MLCPTNKVENKITIRCFVGKVIKTVKNISFICLNTRDVMVSQREFARHGKTNINVIRGVYT